MRLHSITSATETIASYSHSDSKNQHEIAIEEKEMIKFRSSMGLSYVVMDGRTRIRENWDWCKVSFRQPREMALQLEISGSIHLPPNPGRSHLRIIVLITRRVSLVVNLLREFRVSTETALQMRSLLANYENVDFLRFILVATPSPSFALGEH